MIIHIRAESINIINYYIYIILYINLYCKHAVVAGYIHVGYIYGSSRVAAHIPFVLTVS